MNLDEMIKEIHELLKFMYFNFNFDVMLSNNVLKENPKELKKLAGLIDEAYDVFTMVSGCYLRMEDD